MRKDTAERVWESLQELGYTPHASLKGVEAKPQLGLVVNAFSEAHAAELIARFHEKAFVLGYDLRTVSIAQNSQQTADPLKGLLDRKVDGIAALVLDPDSSLTAALSRVDVPVICCDSSLAIRRGTALSIDYWRGVREAVQHLALLGHREIAFIGSAPRHSVTQRKSEAVLLALKEIGCTPKWMIEADSSFTGGITGMERLFKFKPLPTAVLCSNDSVALGALLALGRAGISVPDGISLICLDHCQFAAWMAPSVSTVEISIEDFTQTALEALQNIIENPPEQTAGNILKVPTSLVLRGSTSYPPGRALPKSSHATSLGERASTS